MSIFAGIHGLEADDIMAILFFKERGEKEVTIFSGDNDLLQLIPYGAKVARKFDGGSFEYIDEDYITAKYGVPSKYLLRYRCLVGDPSDRIPALTPRFNRKFCRSFAKAWLEKGLDESVADHTLDFNGRDIVRNNMAA